MTAFNDKTKDANTDNIASKDLKSGVQTDKKELSDEDKQLVEILQMLVERITDATADEGLKMAAMGSLEVQIKDSTTSISSIPKALKYLLPHFPTLKDAHSQMPPNSQPALHLAHILAVLAMSFEDKTGKGTTEGAAKEGKRSPRESLYYQLSSSALKRPVDSWGHEFAKHLAKEIGEEYKETGKLDHMRHLISELVPFFLRHNAEPDACDLLVEVDMVEEIREAVKVESDGVDYSRVCRYLASCVPFELFPADQRLLRVIFHIYLDRLDLPLALVTALRLNSPECLRETFGATANTPSPLTLKRQLAFIMARQRVSIDGIGENGAEEEQLQEIMFNSRLSQHYLELARELQIIPPRDPDELFKNPATGSTDPLRIIPKAETSKSNLAIVIGNAILNAGYCRDKLLCEDQEQFLWKNKDVALMTAAASLGAINMWNLGEGLSVLDSLFNQYQGSANPQAPNVQAGALLGIGLMHSGIRNESDPAFALLREPLETSNDLTIRTGAILGLSFAYSGSGRLDVSAFLIPLISDPELQVSVFAALGVANIMVGSANGDASSSILQAMMERDAIDLNKPIARFYSLSIALLCYGKPEAAEAILETLMTIDQHPIGQDTRTLVEALAYAGSGNIDRIHSLLGVLQQYNLERKQKEDKKRAEEKAKAENRSVSSTAESTPFESLSAVYAVIGMALISITEEIGQEMALRMFNHVMHYGDSAIRRTVPLAIGLLYASHPTLPVMDTLSKLSHDSDKGVALSAIIAMGLVGSGTNHAKVAQLLRQLTAFHARDQDCLLAVRIAQSMVHMGKGILTLSPIRMHRALVSPAGLAGLLSGIIGWTCSTSSSFVLNDHPYLIYYFLAAATPRFLICLRSDSLEAVPVPVRVGQAVDTVAQAGRPRTITGFQTHSTPVVIGYSEQAELATEKFVCVSPILEGFVLVKSVEEE